MSEGDELPGDGESSMLMTRIFGSVLVAIVVCYIAACAMGARAR